MIIHNIFVKRNRATVFLLAAFAPFIVLGQNTSPKGEMTPCRNGAMVKNLMAPNTPPCSASAMASSELTRREVKKLTKSATSPQDYLKLAGYHQAQADRLDAESVAYAKAAAAYREGPKAKNLMAPNTAARFDRLADSLRDKARVELASAVSNTQMAENAAQERGSVAGQ